MEHLIFYGYKISFGDLIKTFGVILTAILALFTIFINHYFALRRLKIDIENKNEQDRLDKVHSLELEKLKNHLVKIEEVFYLTLELGSVARSIRSNLNNVVDINSLKVFIDKLDSNSNELETLDNKIRVICNVYLLDSLIDNLFIAGFNVIIASFPLNVICPAFDESEGTEEERFNSVSNEIASFSDELDSFLSDINDFEQSLIDKIEEQQENVS